MNQSNNGLRDVQTVVISDVHLGTYGCQAKELPLYLESINPERIILNGDIIDAWQFSKRYFPKWHIKVIQHLIKWISEGKEMIYLTGNHDEMLRKFVGFEMNNFQLRNKYILELDNNEKAWLFHGDVFDVTMKHSKWLAKLGGSGYNLLIIINKMVNWFSKKLGRGKVSFSKAIKNGVKGAVKKANNFEETAADIAIDNGYNYVVCGHIHKPVIKPIVRKKGSVTYLNSGDWVENLTALEYNNGTWSIFEFYNSDLNSKVEEIKDELKELDDSFIFSKLLEEFNISRVEK